MSRWKIVVLLLYAGLSAATIMAAVLLYWTLVTPRVLTVNNGPVPVRPTTQAADQLVFLNVNYCKNVKVTGTVRRTLVSKTVRIVLPIQTDNGPTGCTQVDVPLLIPKQIAPDTYTVHIEVTYQVNPLKQVIETIDSQPFTIQ